MSMVINHNLPSMNTLNKLTKNSNATNKSMEKLSSGLRINRAGDDAAGLAISEKMRGQIRGLDQANANAQDATNMLNTAEGALGTTEDILQRMKELATQAANDTSVKSDRDEIQKEINQLTSEINRIGNTTEFNTQKLLKGDGEAALQGINVKDYGNLKSGVDEVLAQGSNTITMTGTGGTATSGTSISFTIGGQTLSVVFGTADTSKDASKAQTVNNAGTNATVIVSSKADPMEAAAENAAAIRDAFQQMIEKNSTLKGNVQVTGTGLDITVSAVKGGVYDGVNASANGLTRQAAFTTNLAAVHSSAGATGKVLTTGVAAHATISFTTLSTTGSANVNAAYAGKGMTINGVAIEFYDGSKGAYTGKVKGVDISGSQNSGDIIRKITEQVKVDGMKLTVGANNAGNPTLLVTATDTGTKGNELSVQNGTIQKDFTATFQVGANQGQSMSIEIGDARAAALGVAGMIGGRTADGAVYTTGNVVTNGSTNTVQEAALDVSNHTNATNAIATIEKAIESVSSSRSKIGAYTNRLEYTIDQVTNTSENISASESRIRDVDMASEMMKYQTKSVNMQAAQAMLAQANQAPQNVLSLLR